MHNFREYLNYAEKYIESSQEEVGDVTWLLIPSILLSWVSIESFINNMLDDFAALPPDLFELHEHALLLEQQVRFIDEGENKGTFSLEKKEYRRLEEKIFFLLAKFGKNSDLSKGDRLWQDFDKLKELRNELMHPRKHSETMINIDTAENSLLTSKNIIKFVAKNVWGKPVDI